MITSDGARGRADVVGQLADAAGQQHPDVGLVQFAGGRDRVLHPSRQRLVVERHQEAKPIGRCAEPADVAIVEERHPVVGPQRLVDAFAVQEPVIVDRDDGVLGRGDRAVDVNRTAKRHGPRSYSN